jgi:transketolase
MMGRNGDAYSIKPLNERILREAATDTRALITVEDHYAEGGLGEAVRSVPATDGVPLYSLAVRKIPKSGRPEELLDYEEISQRAIVEKIREISSAFSP